MIDWLGVVIGAIWIVGLAILLAVISIAYWQSSATATPLRHVLGARSFRTAVVVGVILFGLGMLLGAEGWWQKILWGVIIVLSAWEALDANTIRR